jgi:hypothetical protein
MSLDHIVDSGYVIIEPLHDPLEDASWLDAASDDMLAYATPILGPLTTLLIYRMATYFAAGDTWHQFDLDQLACSFGVSGRGSNSPLVRTLGRIDRFGFGQVDAHRPTVRIRTMIPPIPRRLAERMPGYLADTCPYIIR